MGVRDGVRVANSETQAQVVEEAEQKVSVSTTGEIPGECHAGNGDPGLTELHVEHLVTDLELVTAGRPV